MFWHLLKDCGFCRTKIFNKLFLNWIAGLFINWKQLEAEGQGYLFSCYIENSELEIMAPTYGSPVIRK